MVTAPTIESTPVHSAGIDMDDEILSIDGEVLGAPERVDEIVRRHKPGDTITAVIRRRGFSEPVTISLQDDPRLELIPAETSGRALSPDERAFRDAIDVYRRRRSGRLGLSCVLSQARPLARDRVPHARENDE